MKRRLYLLLTVWLMVVCGCNNQTNYYNQVAKDLDAKLEALDYRTQFEKIIDKCADDKEKEAISFLYAYMPLGDIADYESDLYLEGIRYAFMAQKEMPWGSTVPEDIFRHFVLPLRVNNENLDSARTVFYKELKDRVSGLSMYDAVLEVNHWCHEKVIYTPSDARTSSPLASVRTAYGRCGEESTFTVAALRSVGIPARQVYTPRWAHTDDNHAWVEAWVDGTWYYLGACEPEAKLNVAWFSSTALRALLMHNRVFGYYKGSEDIIQRTKCFTEINVTANYAPVARLQVKVVDTEGKPVKGAKVEYKIYNYAEFYSAIKTVSDKNGLSSAILGKGDILIWAAKYETFGYVKARAGESDEAVTIVLDKKVGDLITEDIDIVPPAEGEAVVSLTDEETAANNARLHYEDSIRNQYVATFAKPAKRSIWTDALIASRGNWIEITDFIISISESAIMSDAVSREYYRAGKKLLKMISAKDLRDTPASVLLDHLDNFEGIETEDEEVKDIYDWYVLNPRIANEMLSPWRSCFMNNEEIAALNGSPEEIIRFTNSILILDEYNPQNIPITPVGVLKLRSADSNSRDIFFIALCRSQNIPARIEEISGKVQYWENGTWIDVDFGTQMEPATADKTAGNAPQGSILITYNGQSHLDDPKFETHFTLAKIEDGTINTLTFRDKEGFEGTMSWKNTFSKPIALDCGYYMLTSGTRMASGKVLSRVTFFNIEKDKTTEVELIMRDDPNDLQVIGNFNADPLLPLTGRGMFVLAFMNANHEPSNHAIRSLFEQQWNVPVIIMYKNESDLQKFKGDTFPAPPEKVTVTIDEQGVLKEICTNMKITKPEMPVIVLADSFGRIFTVSQGYSIGIAERLKSHVD
ncbi:MAG: transglutaminase-like domain-containing protein [Bacteroidales bacterium]